VSTRTKLSVDSTCDCDPTDVIETYKYLHGIYAINSSTFLPLSVPVSAGINTRGHSLKLQKRDCKSVLRANTLGFRIVNLWNSLPEDVVSAPTVNSLKNRFDRHCSHLRYSYNWKDFKVLKISLQAELAYPGLHYYYF